MIFGKQHKFSVERFVLLVLVAWAIGGLCGLALLIPLMPQKHHYNHSANLAPCQEDQACPRQEQKHLAGHQCGSYRHSN